MASRIKIEWSGYFDFPSGNYSHGSKQGQPMSGEFWQERIDISSMSGMEYSIDEGAPSQPSSPSVRFSIKARSENTGNPIYNEDYIQSLKRTREYGSIKKEGDLFIRITAVDLDNKVIYRGIVEKISFSKRRFDIHFQCGDLGRFFQNSKRKMLRTFSFPKAEVISIKGTQDAINFLPAQYSSKTGVRDLLGRNCELELVEIAVHSNRERVNRQFGSTPTSKTHVHPVDSFNWVLFQEWDGHDFVKRYGYPSLLTWTNRGTFGVFPNQKRRYDTEVSLGNKRNVFLQIGDSTILTYAEFYTFYDIWVWWNTFLSTTQGDFDGAIRWDFRIRFVHANNGNVIIQNSDGELVVLERGRFLKSTDDSDNANFEVGDIVNVQIHDYKLDNSQTGDFEIISDSDFTSGAKNGSDLSGLPFVHGVPISPIGNSIVFDGGFRNIFNSFLKTVNMCNENLSKNLTHDNSSVNIVSIPSVVESLFQWSYISDLMHYGWVGSNLIEALVKMAMQTCSFIFTNEDGLIELKSRTWAQHQINKIGKAPDFFIEIDFEDIEFVDGDNYSYGFDTYEVSFNDIIEINNLLGEAFDDVIIDREGIAIDTGDKTTSLNLENYRTSDLGVPTEDMLDVKDSNLRVFRRNPQMSGLLPFSFFNPKVVEQAKTFANSFPYPGVKRRVRINPHEKERYKNIKIGSDIMIEEEVWSHENSQYEKKSFLYLVKRISYSISQMLEHSNYLYLDLVRLSGEITEQSFESSISGTVRRCSDSEQLEGVSLWLTRFNEESQSYRIVESLETDVFGFYNFQDISSGTYRILGQKDGYENYQSSDIIVSSAQNLTRNFCIIQIEEETNAFLSGIISNAQELVTSVYALNLHDNTEYYEQINMTTGEYEITEMKEGLYMVAVDVNGVIVANSEEYMEIDNSGATYNFTFMSV